MNVERLDNMDGPILHLEFATSEEAQQTMVRIQEYYESPIVGIRGKVFTHADYFEANKLQNGGRYLYDWTGFNVPGHIVRQFFRLFDTLSPAEAAIKTVVDSLGQSEKFYLIATCDDDPDADTFAHEMCHACFYLDPAFKAYMTTLVDGVSHFDVESFEVFRRWLVARGYDESVLVDECQAYLGTTPKEWWASEDAGMSEGDARTMWRIGAPFRDFLKG